MAVTLKAACGVVLYQHPPITNRRLYNITIYVGKSSCSFPTARTHAPAFPKIRERVARG